MDSTDTTITGACPHDCPDTCSLLSTVRDGRVVKVAGNPAHPMTDGVLCAKVARYDQRLYHPERLLTPLKRVGPKGPGAQWQAVSWDQALDAIAQRLGEIAARDPRAILPYHYAGTMGLVQGGSLCTRFFNRLGASQLDATICASAGATALAYTLGSTVGMPVETFAQSKVIVIWGSNSITSNLHFWRIAQQAKRDGAKLICIDPRRTETAEKCHDHLAIRPGTDAALAFAVINACVRNGWVDDAYVAQYTVGWPELRARAMDWPVARAAEVCGVPVAQIESLARDLATTQPAAIRVNYGVQRVKGGANAVRAVLCIPAVTGAWRHVGGGALLSNSGRFPKQMAALEQPELRAKGLAGRPNRIVNMTTIGHDLLRDSSAEFGPKLEALVVFNSNPVAIAPDSKRVVQGFARDDLFTVVLEHFMTDTADYADYVLPATQQLEHWDIHASYGHTDVLLNRPAVAPMGEAKPNTEIFRQLAHRLGFDEPGFQDSDEALCRQAFAASDVPFDRLLQQGFVSLPVPQAPFAHGGFPTPSGKCEFVSERLAAQGLDPLPQVIANIDAPTARYPLAMISPPARNFLNSSFVNVDSLQASERQPLLEIHPDDATPRGIASGDVVDVFNDRGRYRCVAEVGLRARPGVVSGLSIWWRKLGLNGTNVNELTSATELTDLGRAPTFYDCAVEVEKV